MEKIEKDKVIRSKKSKVKARASLGIRPGKPSILRPDIIDSIFFDLSEGNLELVASCGFYALSWKPYQGDSLNLPDHRVEFVTTCSCTNYKEILSIKIQESRKLKHKDKDFRNSDIQDLPSRYQVYQGRLLASFQNDAKYEHGGQDTRSQGDKVDQD
uniref:Uncharacterized protein n=1 Tax=Tanacetum cinerariifolium TaxID=118510 RepID=A0A699HDF0_TANCI|nr:hypothetical protein [Tanacetum cinerariifolium]